jgi:hypothetical protein
MYLGARSPFMHHRTRFSVGLAASPPGQTQHSTLSLGVIIHNKSSYGHQRLHSLAGYTRFSCIHEYNILYTIIIIILTKDLMTYPASGCLASCGCCCGSCGCVAGWAGRLGSSGCVTMPA